MAKAAPKASTNVTIPRRWQLSFIGIVTFSWVMSLASMLWSYFRYSHYMSAGTWAFQIVDFIYPLLYVVIGYIFVMKRVRGTVPRLFWAVLLAVTGLLGYMSLQLPLNEVTNALHLYATGRHASWWQTFGWIWSQMLAMLLVYGVVLWLVAWRSKRR